MRKALSLALWVGLLAASLQAGTVTYDVTALPFTPGSLPPGEGLYRYTYVLSNINLEANQELDIEFDAALYGLLSNGQAGAGFALLLFQPNDPPGADGDYSALALTNSASMAGPFSVDFIYLGPGQPGSQAYSINQFDANGAFISTLADGYTSLAGNSQVPEPGAFWLASMGLAMAGGWWMIRRRSRCAE